LNRAQGLPAVVSINLSLVSSKAKINGEWHRYRSPHFRLRLHTKPWSCLLLWYVTMMWEDSILITHLGTQYSPASFVDSRSIVCRSVAQAYYGQQHLNVSVTPNSVDFTIRNLTFSYEIECPSGCSGRGVCINGYVPFGFRVPF
jgi:hypothetical protein